MKLSKMWLYVTAGVWLVVGMFSMNACIDRPPKAPDTLNGRWCEEGSGRYAKHSPRHYTEIAVRDSMALLLTAGSSIWSDAVAEGYMSTGEPCMRHIVSLGGNRYTCETLYPFQDSATSQTVGVTWRETRLELSYDRTSLHVEIVPKKDHTGRLEGHDLLFLRMMD